MVRHPKVLAWEKDLKEVFDEIDDYIEDRYGATYPLRPLRPPRGTTSSKSHDGLFNVGAAFSAGYGSEKGRGYVVEVRFATLRHVPVDVREQVEEEVAVKLRELLPVKFPGQTMHVDRDGQVYKIWGDLSLGEV
ncbi:MAG: hypothetical protein KJ626_04970 [Verrucomicrobia bacterium]|nr:hypothetical protein [Verrucomicrobiota bacterium]